MEELPPGQRYVPSFIEYSALGRPEVNLETWRLRVRRLVERELELSYEELRKLPQIEILSDFHCVTGWSVRGVRWKGVRISLLAEMAGVKPEAKWAKFACVDGYHTSVPIEDALAEESIIVLEVNGSPLSREMGFPARPFIPHLYAWKSAKWLELIEFLPYYPGGYWESRGYHPRGNVWAEERRVER